MINLLKRLYDWLGTLILLLQKNAVEASFGAMRSGSWPSVRKEFLKVNPFCEICGTMNDISVHHIKPFHKEPALELNGENLISLCTPHHYLFGHLRSWFSWNETVKEDARVLREKIANRPKG